MKKRKSKIISEHGRVFVTGDKHRDFSGIIKFCRKNRLGGADTIIILGNSGINYYGDYRDRDLKGRLSEIGVTLLCIHGNNENRPQNIDTYIEKGYMGGRVLYEAEYPRILFAVDCSIYRFDGFSAAVIGGAHSRDKFYRLENSLPYWFDEEPCEETKRRFASALKNEGWSVDYVLSHAAPLKFVRGGTRARENSRKADISDLSRRFFGGRFCNGLRKTGFIGGILSAACLFGRRALRRGDEYIDDPDMSFEIWLDGIEERLAYRRWYAGHYLIDSSGADAVLMLDRIEELT